MPRILSNQDIEEFRDRLCDAAEKLFADHGLEAVTMRELAAELGVSPMTPYRYFKDKEAILAAVRARGFNRHAEALERAYDEASGSLLERASAVAVAYVRFAFENPEAYKLMFDIAQQKEAEYPELVTAGERSRRTMTRHLKEMIKAGELKGDPDLIGHVYWAAIHGPIMLQFSGMLPPAYGAQRIIAELAAALNARFFPDA